MKKNVTIYSITFSLQANETEVKKKVLFFHDMPISIRFSVSKSCCDNTILLFFSFFFYFALLQFERNLAKKWIDKHKPTYHYYIFAILFTQSPLWTMLMYCVHINIKVLWLCSVKISFTQMFCAYIFTKLSTFF